MSSTFIYDAPLAYDSDQAYDAYGTSVSSSTTYPLAHLSAQLALGPDGSFDFLYQDTIDEVSQSVEMVCGTVIGDRTVVPQFGIPNQVFTQPSKIEITNAIGTWEPRATVSVSVNTNEQTGDSTVGVAVSLAKGASV